MKIAQKVAWPSYATNLYNFRNEADKLKLSPTICASFIFHGQTAQYAQREKENRTAYAAASVVIF